MQPDPWLTFWLAAGGAGAALASGFGSVWALTQKRRYLPKPLMETSAARGESAMGYDPKTGSFDVRYEVLSFTTINSGDGAAHDVRLMLHGPTGPTSESKEHPALGLRASLSVAIALSEHPELVDEYGNKQMLTSEGVDPSGFWAELTWRQAPNMKRVHRKIIREKH